MCCVVAAASHIGAGFRLAIVDLCRLISAFSRVCPIKRPQKETRSVTARRPLPGEQTCKYSAAHRARGEGLVYRISTVEGHLAEDLKQVRRTGLTKDTSVSSSLKSRLILQESPDLKIDMHTSVLDLKTRILSSQERKRSNAQISTSRRFVEFDTNTRTDDYRHVKW